MGNINADKPNSGWGDPVEDLENPSIGDTVVPAIPSIKLAEINTSDTISQFMEKVNNNFETLIRMGGGPAGVEGEKGDPGVPTKPKVFVHAWRLGYEFRLETEITENKYELEDIQEDLTNCKYQEGHIIILQNAHVYRLELNNNTYKLEPKFLIALQSYDPSSVVNGKTAHMHIAYSNSDDGSKDFITDEELRENTKNNISGGTEVIDPELGEPITPFSLKNTTTDIEDSIQGTKTYKANYQYMGIYCDNDENPKTHQSWYTWFKIRGDKGDKGIQGETGPQGPQGIQGVKGDKGDNFTGHSYTIDLEGDMSMIPIKIDRKTNTSCECVLHAYYGNNNVKLDKDKVEINIPEEYKNIGVFEKEQSENDVKIKFKPDENFVFPTTTIMFTIHVDDTVRDTSDNKVYRFVRDTVWMVKGIVSTFSLEIIPNSHTIKLDEDGNYNPETLIVDVYKCEDGKREKFDLTNSDFELKYKKNTDNTWYTYNNDIDTTDLVSCVELKVVKDDEIWDYEDVWVVADGKSTHYYHADLGAAESMMVLVTGDEYEITNDDGSKHKCAEIRTNKSGYNTYEITFDVTFFDGSTSCVPKSIGFGSTDELYVKNETFVRTLTETELEPKTVNGETKYVSTLEITRVPANVDMIPMSFIVQSNSSDGNTIQDIIYFNVYISTLSDIFTLVPTKTSFNTSVGEEGETIGCNVFKDYTNISNSLDEYNLSLYYQKNGEGVPKPYENPLTFGADENGFVSSDNYIDFILYHTFTNPIDPNQKTTKEIAISTIPLIKDGINGVDGNSWQYIFCRSSKYPFDQTGFSNPSKWKDNDENNPNNELLGNNGYKDENWYDDHKGVDSKDKYEYQSYRKWDKVNKKWSAFGEPTLYSNYSESGSGYSVILSNPISIIPVGDDWSTDEGAEYQKDSTVVYLYNNMNEIKSGITLSLPDTDPYVGKNFKCNGNTVEFEPVVEGSVFNFDGNNQYKLPITLTYENEDDKFSTTVYWTLTPIKGTVDIEVFVDKYVVNTSDSTEHKLQVGYTKTSDGKKTTITKKEDGEYKIKLSNDINNLDSVQIVETWDNATYNFVEDNKNRNCYVVLLDNDDKIIDYVIVTAVSNGEPGKSAIHLELTQDYISLPGNGNSGIDSNYNYEFVESEMILYNGDTPIVDGLSYSFKVNETETGDIYCYESGKFKIPTSIIKGNTTIECVAIYNKISYYKTLIIELVDTAYELEINKNIITRNINTGEIIDNNLEIIVKYWQNGRWNNTDTGTVIARSAVREDDQEVSIKNGYIRSVTLDNNMFKQDTQVEIYFKDNNEQIRTKETIGIVDSGKDGVTPSCNTVKIIGYSLLDIDVNTSDGWEDSLNALGTLSPGQQIYLRNEYKWSDGTTTYGKTTTMAGTQGSSGKSRVLFYLGSFKDGTLTGSDVTGLLNDERCDYYLDNEGQAWMRTGEGTEIAFGSCDGPDNINNPHWKQSETVGFLKAGAISADMINTGSLVADKSFITNLFAQEVSAENLTVNAAKIKGQLNIGTGDNQVKITEHAITAKMINADDLKVKAANIEGELTASQINAKDLNVNAANIEGKLTASQINAKDLKVEKLITNPETGKSSVNILNNQISICDNNFNNVCVFSDNELNVSINEAFGSKNKLNIIVSRDWILSRIDNTSEYTNNFTLTPENTITNIGHLTSGTHITISLSIDTHIDDYKVGHEYEETKWYNDNTTFNLTIKPVIYIYKDNDKPSQIEGSVKTIEKFGSEIGNIGNILNELTYTYTITNDGIYKMGVGFTGSVIVKNAPYEDVDIPMSVTGNKTTVTVDSTNTTCKTEICKDGIFIKRESDGILFGTDGIMFKFGNKMLRIDNDGIKYSIADNYGTPDWKYLT